MLLVFWEFGIRVAAAAQPVQLRRSGLSRPVILLLSGTNAGPLVFAGVLVSMALLGLVATWLRARRALGIHPASLLQEE